MIQSNTDERTAEKMPAIVLRLYARLQEFAG